MTLYLEWEANHRHSEAQRIAKERHRHMAAAHDTPSLMSALKRLFGGKGTATITSSDATVHQVAVKHAVQASDNKHRKAS